MNFKEIKTQLQDVIEYSQDLKDIDASKLANDWFKAKSDFIEFFGGSPIYSTKEPITIFLDDEQRFHKIQDFIDLIYRKFDYPDLINFVKFNKNNFFTNIVQEPYQEDGYNIPSGIKISKAFKSFVSNDSDLYYIQTAASRIIQENHITGYLCLSVHPLDYLSSSENTHKWRSCHSLDGDYRSGNLSYMLDKSTIVCYITNEKETELPNFPRDVLWNSKKWRMLLFVSDNWNALFAGRHYPFFSKSIMNEIKSRWLMLCATHENHLNYFKPLYSSWHKDCYDLVEFKEHSEDNFSLKDVYIPMRDSLYKMTDLITDYTEDPIYFNDLLKSSCYTPYYCWNNESTSTIHFSIGAPVTCPKCNKHILTDSSHMICDACLERLGYVHCADCNEMITDDEAIWVDNGGYYICQRCFEDNYFVCPNCGEVFNIRDGYWSDAEDQYLCRSCYESLES